MLQFLKTFVRRPAPVRTLRFRGNRADTLSIMLNRRAVIDGGFRRS